MSQMAGRKKHSAEDVVRKLRRADELAAEVKTNEEIAAELEVSNTRLKRLLAEAELEKDALREVAKGSVNGTLRIDDGAVRQRHRSLQRATAQGGCS